MNYEIKSAQTASVREIYYDKNLNKMVFKNDLGIITPLDDNNIPFLESNLTDKTVWNNGQGNIATNTSYGDSALKSNTTGSANTAIGNLSLGANTIGTANTAIGYGVLAANTIGNFNTALGVRALEVNSTASNNTAIGYRASASNTTGIQNSSYGSDALLNNTSGNNLSAFGFRALLNNLTGINNTAIGATSLQSNTIGQNNTAVGFNTDSGDFSGSVILGANAAATGNNQFVIGSSTTNAGSVVSEVNSSTQVWNVVINGVARKILLA